MHPAAHSNSIEFCMRLSPPTSGLARMGRRKGAEVDAEFAFLRSGASCRQLRAWPGWGGGGVCCRGVEFAFLSFTLDLPWARRKNAQFMESCFGDIKGLEEARDSFLEDHAKEFGLLDYPFGNLLANFLNSRGLFTLQKPYNRQKRFRQKRFRLSQAISKIQKAIGKSHFFIILLTWVSRLWLTQ